MKSSKDENDLIYNDIYRRDSEESTLIPKPSHFTSNESILDKNKPKRRFETCWHTYPNIDWDISWYFGIRGAESFHLYLWVMKDLSWTQDWFISGHIFGILAFLWSLFLLYHAYTHRNIKEVCVYIGQMLWLFANLWWMSGELYDFMYPGDNNQLYDHRTVQAGYIMLVALIWLAIYFVIIKHIPSIQPTDEQEAIYNISFLKSRIPFLFKTWRDYENSHIFFWLAKDYSWNRLNPVAWIIFVIPTIAIALDFVFISLFNEKLLIEHAHYISQFIWVLANICWAYGEIFDPSYDYPYSLFSSSKNRLITFRWYSSWLLIVAMIPIIGLYIIWYRKPRDSVSVSVSVSDVNNSMDNNMDSQLDNITSHNYHTSSGGILSSLSRSTDSVIHEITISPIYSDDKEYIMDEVESNSERRSLLSK